jgi:hypothetical protein
MMGQREVGQGQFFYAFDLDRVVPSDHLVRQIDPVLDLSWVHKELAPYYSHTGRPSIDPVLMIRMLIIGYVFAIRSERAICAELKVNLAYRWFCKLSIEDDVPDHSVANRRKQFPQHSCRRAGSHHQSSQRQAPNDGPSFTLHPRSPGATLYGPAGQAHWVAVIASNCTECTGRDQWD